MALLASYVYDVTQE